MDIGYKYIYQKVPGLIYIKGDGSTDPGDTYLSRFSNNYYNVSIRPVVRPHFIGRYSN